MLYTIGCCYFGILTFVILHKLNKKKGTKQLPHIILFKYTALQKFLNNL